MLDVLLEFGVNHWDTAAGYGVAEDRMKPWLATHRDDVFLATKTGDWEGDAARASLERSLERMGVDHVDLIQLHNLVEEDEWQTAHGPGGAARGARAGPRRGVDPVHRRHRPRRAHRRDARPQPGALRLRLRAAAVQLRAARGRPVPSRRRASARRVRRAAGRRAGDQGGRPTPLVRRRRRTPAFVVRAASRGRRVGARRALRARPRAAVPDRQQRDEPAAGDPHRRVDARRAADRRRAPRRRRRGGHAGRCSTATTSNASDVGTTVWVATDHRATLGRSCLSSPLAPYSLPRFATIAAGAAGAVDPPGSEPGSTIETVDASVPGSLPPELEVALVNADDLGLPIDWIVRDLDPHMALDEAERADIDPFLGLLDCPDGAVREGPDRGVGLASLQRRTCR